MALIVQKYGGTSVGSLPRIHHVVDKILKTRAEGHQVVVVVSAMSGETDRLVALAQKLSITPNPREFDVLLSTGEQVAMALLSMALIDKGCPARSYTGAQVQIRTDSVHNKARILEVEGSKIQADLASGTVVVVAGFQGVDDLGNITTLGRGGSDTTAVALAAALQADECQIYTDVNGIYTADPRIVPYARQLSQVTCQEMIELASQGAKVMQIRAVEFAGRYNVPVRVLSTFKEGSGTLIIQSLHKDHSIVSGIAYNRDEAKFVLRGLSDLPGIAAQILNPLSDAHIEVDMLVQTPSINGATDLTFTVHKRDFNQVQELLENSSKTLKLDKLEGNDQIAKISLVGMGLRSHPKVASTMFHTLGVQGINIQLISTSEIKVSVVIDEEHLERGVCALHEAFQLGKEPKEVEIN